MMKHLVFASLTACVTTGSPLVEVSAPRARVRLELAPHADTLRVFPAAITLGAPRVDRIGREIRSELGETATAELDLCVSADGHVTRASLVAGSTYARFDQALLADASRWRFAAMPGPATLATCERARVTYRAY